jgi:hypothetical protein
VYRAGLSASLSIKSQREIGTSVHVSRSAENSFSSEIIRHHVVCSGFEFRLDHLVEHRTPCTVPAGLEGQQVLDVDSSVGADLVVGDLAFIEEIDQELP